MDFLGLVVYNILIRFPAHLVACRAYTDTFTRLPTGFVAYPSHTRHFFPGFQLILSPIPLIHDTFCSASTRFCRLSRSYATLLPDFQPVLSPIPLIRDTFTRLPLGFVAYPAYTRHFYPASNRFCRLSLSYATLLPGFQPILSPIPLIRDTFTRLPTGFVAYPSHTRHFYPTSNRFCRLTPPSTPKP
ncbi:hypothetical protein J2Y67_001826 [Neobacillus niacini]|nr:hypothetical protein [Neobacillus niacini]